VTRSDKLNAQDSFDATDLADRRFFRGQADIRLAAERENTGAHGPGCVKNSQISEIQKIRFYKTQSSPQHELTLRMRSCAEIFYAPTQPLEFTRPRSKADIPA
jgi:hypothetical protein